MPKDYPCSRCGEKHEEEDLVVVISPGIDTLCIPCLGREYKKLYDTRKKRYKEFYELLDISGLQPHWPTVEAGMKGSSLGKGGWVTRPMTKEDAIELGRKAAWDLLLRAWEETL